MTKINSKYKGTNSATISTFRGDHVIEFGLHKEDLNRLIKDKRDALGPDYVTLQRFDNIDSGRPIEHILKNAVDKLNKGEYVDLTKILE